MYPPVGSARKTIVASPTDDVLSETALECRQGEAGTYDVVRQLRTFIHGPHGGAGHVSDDFVLAINVAPEKYNTGAGKIVIEDVEVVCAGATAKTFGTAWTIAANKYGCIGIYVSIAGTVFTDNATPVVPAAPLEIGYDTAAEALASLPLCANGTVLIGYMAIANNAVLWTANVDDMTNASDVTTATFNNIVSPDVVVEVMEPMTMADAAPTWHVIQSYIPLAHGTGGMQALLELAGWKGVRLRVRSNGEPLSQELSAFWSS